MKLNPQTFNCQISDPETFMISQNLAKTFRCFNRRRQGNFIRAFRCPSRMCPRTSSSIVSSGIHGDRPSVEVLTMHFQVQ
jgi:hypothetical protein